MTCPYCGAVVLAASNRCASCDRALPSGRQVLTGLLTPVPLLSSITNTALPEADTSGLPCLTDTAVTTLADMTVPDSEAATRFGDAAAAAETFFETGGRTSGSANDSPTAGPLAVGQAFGNRYHIIRALGVGGMGAVYQAWDAELGVAVAIKVIRPEVMADRACRGRSRAALQARAAARPPGHAQERRPHSRPRRDRRHQVHHDVVRRRARTWRRS